MMTNRAARLPLVALIVLYGSALGLAVLAVLAIG